MAKMDDYIRLLEKRAGGGGLAPTYDYDLDNEHVGIEEFKRNVKDRREELGKIFTNLNPTVKHETSMAKKWFPRPTKATDVESTTPLVKMASQAFAESRVLQDRSPAYQMVAIRAFNDELEKIAFAVTEKGHKFDAEKHRLLARQSAEQAEHLQQPEYNALGTSAGIGSPLGALRFHYMTGSGGRPDVEARHHEYVAKKHEEGRNAWNPWGGLSTPSSYEQGATPGFFGHIGVTKVKKQHEAAKPE